jgi:hypothetical protein
LTIRPNDRLKALEIVQELRDIYAGSAQQTRIRISLVSDRAQAERMAVELLAYEATVENLNLVEGVIKEAMRPRRRRRSSG